MKANLPTLTAAVSRAFQSRCNIHETALPYWQGRIETLLHHGENEENTLAVVTVEMVSHLISRSLTGSRDKRQSKGGSPDAGGLAVPSGLTWRETMETLIAQGARAKQGKRQPITLSETDSEEIRGTVALVLSERGTFSRALSSEDIGEAFRLVEGRKCLNLNRRWKACDDGEKTLSQLSQPTYDADEEQERIACLTERLEQCQACMDAAFKADDSKRRVHLRKRNGETLAAIVMRKQTGNGVSKQHERQTRKELAVYLKRGATALISDRLKSSPWQFDLVTALEALEAANA